MPERDTYCSYCGTAFTPPLGYPRTCANVACRVTIWANPIPVSVVLAPIVHRGRTGLLVVRRAIEPRRGKLALVGGFLEEHETWQEGGAREVREEAGVTIDPASLEALWFTSTEPRPNRVLLFSVAPPADASTLLPHRPSAETAERGLVFGSGGLEEVFAFPLHVGAARRFLEPRGLTGPHDYTVI